MRCCAYRGGLVAFRDDTFDGPMLAEAGRFRNEASLQFRCARAIKFHNGATMTADDVGLVVEAVVSTPCDAISAMLCPKLSATRHRANREDRGAGSADFCHHARPPTALFSSDPRAGPIAGRPLSSTGIPSGRTAVDSHRSAPARSSSASGGGDSKWISSASTAMSAQRVRAPVTHGAKDFKVDRVRFQYNP